jgi:hypothetical protein
MDVSYVHIRERLPISVPSYILIPLFLRDIVVQSARQHTTWYC